MSRLPAFDRTLRIGACVGAVLVAGCGGDDGGEIPVPPPPELLQITANNQVAVARATAVNYFSLDSLRDIPTATASDAGRGSVAATVKTVKYALGKALGAASDVKPFAIVTRTEPCAVSGSITMTLDDRDNTGTLSAGDVLSATFTECRDDPGEPSSLIAGNFAVNVSSYSDPLLSGLFSFGQLALSDSDGTISLNGQANVAYAASRDAVGTWTTRVDMKVAAAGLVASVTTAAYRETFTYDPDFAAVWNDVTPVAAPGYSTAVLGGRFLAASLGAKLVLATDPPIRDVWGEDGPDSGAATITGYQSKLKLTVLSTTTARLELDANDDGTFESARDIPWTELLPL